MTDCVYFLLYLALGKLSLMLLINYYYYVNIATELLAGLCTLQGMGIHLLLDKYKSQSTCIKDNERKLRCRTKEVFIITGPQQIQKTILCQIGKKTVLLKKSLLNLC